MTEVVAHGEVVNRAEELARLIATMNRPALGATYGLYARGEGGALDDALARERQAAAVWRVDVAVAHGRFVAAVGRKPAAE